MGCSETENNCSNATSERSAEQPTGAGLKGAGRATGGFLSGLSGDSRRSNARNRLRRLKTDYTRAQTSVDFVVGMSVFLLTVAFVVGFLPGVFEPFTASGEGDVLASDRTASLLAEQLLADPETPGALNATCTAEFFSESDDGRIDECRFDADAGDLRTALGVSPTTAVNVTIEENGTVRSAGGVTLDAGPTPPESESVVVSRRVVLLGGEESDLYVRVW